MRCGLDWPGLGGAHGKSAFAGHADCTGYGAELLLAGNGLANRLREAGVGAVGDRDRCRGAARAYRTTLSLRPAQSRMPTVGSASRDAEVVVDPADVKSELAEMLGRQSNDLKFEDDDARSDVRASLPGTLRRG